MRGKKKYGWLSGLMSNVLGGTREYNFNNVTYIVEPRFQSVDSEDAKMPQEKFARIIEKSAAHLQDSLDSDKIQAEYVLDSAGEKRLKSIKSREWERTAHSAWSSIIALLAVCKFPNGTESARSLLRADKV